MIMTFTPGNPIVGLDKRFASIVWRLTVTSFAGARDDHNKPLESAASVCFGLFWPESGSYPGLRLQIVPISKKGADRFFASGRQASQTQPHSQPFHVVRLLECELELKGDPRHQSATH
jgi:hypothetical protein